MYSSAFIPKFAAEKILEHVRTLIDHFEDTDDGAGTDYMFMLYVPKDTRIQVLRKLKQWAEPLGAMYATKRLRPMIQKDSAQTRERKRGVFGDERDKTDNKDDKEFAELAVVFGDTAFTRRREPELIPLLEAFRAGNPGSKKQLLEQVDSQWVVNQTVLDMDYEKRTREESGPGMLPNWDFNPADILKNLPNPMTAMMGMMGSSDNSGVLKGISEFFDLLSVSVMSLHERLKIELIAGEMADVFERLQYDGMEHRKQKPTDSEAIDPTLFPRAYDRIHLSNIPDYVGGPLTALMYGMPLLHEGRPSNLRFNNLLNPPMFDTHDHFLAEYMLMHDAKQVADHFGAVREIDPNAPKSRRYPKK
ncbi:hypothetical protein CGLO_08458 [Colletotrichum gloeosporioides Cg-14]|uniref:Uncharacterized protein n=1 Tax=Colletotrichum gloeosporioides (strain Cg-14) TaxID=1237896 RepID=T0LUM2_COLGC|nr:hypothetical protein CGLO_08458 [Colletotrichum gloeosporioides Cg-14]